MNVELLIDSIVRQTMVLIAELATSGGLRAPLAHVADQVFLELAHELEAQGLNRKVSADMFGMALRTYQRKVQRLRESTTERGRSLWEVVYDFVRSKPVVTRRDVLERFHNDDEELVRGVLADLVDSNLVFATGPTKNTSFRAANEAELGAMAGDKERPTDMDLIWALVFRLGPISSLDLAALGSLGQEETTAMLERLVTSGTITKSETAQGTTYRTHHFVVPVGASSGWEAAVFDHFHAVVRTVCAKIRLATETSLADRIGGSTYSFEIWEGHPLAEEVMGTLRRFREVQSSLRNRVRDHNQNHEKPVSRVGVTVYGGQTVWELDHDDEIQ